ncbi:YrdC-like domain [Sesbania bispinosa]|nr:YrdC-like domain [Sesbania bispinosa]
MVVKRSPKRLKYNAANRFTKETVIFVGALTWFDWIIITRRMVLLYIEADSSASDSWRLEPVINLLKEGAVGVIPTDTLYAIACDLRSHSAIERLRRIKNIEGSKPLSILCHSFRDIDKYTAGFPRGDGQGHANLFKAVKHYLPGPVIHFHPYGKQELPKRVHKVGTSICQICIKEKCGCPYPDDAICQAILKEMDAPLICTSIKFLKEDEWMIDPVLIADTYGPEGLDFVVDGGVRVAEPSTVVDMTKMPPRVLRQGKGPILPWMVLEDDQKTDAQEDLIPAAI